MIIQQFYYQSPILFRTKGFVATVQAFRDSSPCSPSTSYSSFLPPSSSRSSSFISNTCKSHIKAVYDFTLAYYHIPTRSLQINAPNILRMYTDRLDKEYAMGIKVRRYPLCELPYCSSSDVYNDDDDTAGRAGRSKHGSDLSHDLVELEVNVGKEKHRQHRDKPVEDDDEEEEDEDESTAILVKKKSIVHHPPLPSLSKREREAEALAAWLVQRFKEKDEFISEFGRQMDQRFLIKNG